MATPKLKILAKRFQDQIQDPVNEDASGNIIPGELVISATELETYLGIAMTKFMENVWNQSAGFQDFLLKLPELYKTGSVVYNIGESTKDLSLEPGLMDVWEVIDSKIDSIGHVEVWNKVHLIDALTSDDPFYQATASRPALIFNKPILYLFPASLTQSGLGTVKLSYIALPIDPDTGEYLKINGNYDIPFSLKQIQDIADIAVSLFRKDNLEQDNG